ncbi:aldose epimerase family protein [Brachyspira sp.]|uniref:aldose epimerase family protein n=1 Tax=Brachyspira sp. TaxID=1977261 RepID=UPI002636B081|nr:aldose epimerase family protein [Brachyspira sp.]
MQIKNFGGGYLLYELKNKNGMILKLTDIGASITGVFFKDKNGNEVQAAFGSDAYSFYLEPHDYIGASVGRVANRTIDSEFILDGKTYKLTKNDNGKHHLHGGAEGISFKKFDSKLLNNNSISFTYFSKEGEEGYPANVNIEIVYTLTDDNEILINYFADADAPTPLNFTNHAYWNLNGEGTIYEHDLFIDSSFYLPVTDECVSTGDILKTENTPFDFTKTKKIGADIEKTNGYDNCFIFNEKNILSNTNNEENNLNKLRASCYSENTGIYLELYTTKPAMHFYSGNMLNNRAVRNTVLNKHNAFCFETEFLPAAMNFPHFPSIIFDSNKSYNHKTIYKLSLK